MIVYLARAIQAFVMYCVNGTSRSSLLIVSTYSMIVFGLCVLLLLLLLLGTLQPVPNESETGD